MSSLAQDINQSRVDAFAERMLAAINGASLAMMTSVGHRTGLFDIMATLPPATSEEVARAAGLNERYVREWLGAMVAGRIVDYTASTRTYALPAEHAAVLTRAAAPDNLAVTTQWISVLGSVESEIVDAFTHGRGVPYSAYGRFHEVMAEESAQTVVAGLERQILPLVPGLTLRLDSGIRALDVGCGRGRALAALAKRFPRSQFVGYDMSAERDRRRPQRGGARPVCRTSRWRSRTRRRIDEPERFDVVFAFDAIHDQARPADVLRNIRRALAANGVFLMQDIAASSDVERNIDHPLGPFTYTVSCMHCMSVSLAEGGAGLGAAWGRELALRMLAEAGFDDVRVEQLPHDVINYYYVAR